MTATCTKCGEEFGIEVNLHRNADQKHVVYVTCPNCDEFLWSDADGLDDSEARESAVACLAAA